MFESFKPKNPHRDIITAEDLNRLNSERNKKHEEIGRAMEHFRQHQGDCVSLKDNNGELGVIIDDEFIMTGFVTSNIETEQTTKPLAALGSVLVSSINGAGLGAYESADTPESQTEQVKLYEYITGTFSQNGFILSIQDTPREFWNTYSKQLEEAGFMIFTQSY